MSDRYKSALALATAAMSRLTEQHWRADTLVHIGGLDVPSAAWRLGIPRPVLMEMLAQVTAARRLGEEADVHRPKPSGIFGVSDASPSCKRGPQSGCRAQVLTFAAVGLCPTEIAESTGVSLIRVSQILAEARATGAGCAA